MSNEKTKAQKTTKAMNSKFKATTEALNWLRATFPKAFIQPTPAIQPLKIGIGSDVFKFLKTNNLDGITITAIRNALRMYTTNAHYLRASSNVGEKRIDLEGNEQGEVTPEQAQYAQTKLAHKKKIREEREAMATPKVKPIEPPLNN